MSNYRTPAPLGSQSNPNHVDANMLHRSRTAQPGVLGFEQQERTPQDNQPLFTVLGPSHAAIELLKKVERLRLKPYDDQTNLEITVWVPGATVGYGHLISRVEWPMLKTGIKQEEANALFERDLAPFVSLLRRKVTRLLRQQEFDALLMLAYNIGGAAFSRSTVLALVNTAPFPTTAHELEMAWKAWSRSQGRVMRGLERRRNCEWNIFTRGIYEAW